MRVLMMLGLLASACEPLDGGLRCTDNGSYGWCGPGTAAWCSDGFLAECEDGAVICNDGSEPRCESTGDGG